jgi:hypothetical protein
MSDDDPRPRDELELKWRQYQLDKEQADTERHDAWRRLPVIITVIAGISAIIFQGLGVWEARITRETEAARAARDFDFKVFELILTQRATLISCNPQSTEKNVSAINVVLSEQLKPALRNLVDGVVSSCVTAAQNSAPQSDSAKPAEQTARYNTLAAQSQVLTAVGQTDAAPRGRVFIQYQAASDRAWALQLQASLQTAGYKAPGIQAVRAAPAGYEVRFYKAGQQAAADQLAAKVQADLKLPAKPQVHSLAGLYPGLPRGVMEVWFPARASAPAAPTEAPAA